MLILNFGHPLPEAQQAKIVELTGEQAERVINLTVHKDCGTREIA
ncbi:MAG: hypothetical protein WCS37_19820 [Chloroflexota bacterium]